MEMALLPELSLWTTCLLVGLGAESRAGARLDRRELEQMGTSSAPPGTEPGEPQLSLGAL